MEWQSKSEQRGTERAPLFVKGEVVTKKDAESVKEDAEDRKVKEAADAALVNYTGHLAAATYLLFAFTAGLFAVTYRLSRDAKHTGDDHASKMERSIAQAERAASAMERVANATIQNATLMQGMLHKQMRAYLTVSVASGIYQERDKNLKFGILPSLLNSGHTPAHKLSYWAKAAVLPFPLPDDFDFPTPESVTPQAMLLGPHHAVELNGHLEDFVPDDEVPVIKSGRDRRVHIWGIVTYTDAFDEVHTTKFCHSICWYGEPGQERITGTYAYRHNEAT